MESRYAFFVFILFLLVVLNGKSIRGGISSTDESFISMTVNNAEEPEYAITSSKTAQIQFGVYLTNANISLGDGYSNNLSIYSVTDLVVYVDNSSSIEYDAIVTLIWSPSTNNASLYTNVTLVSISSPLTTYSTISVPDNGTGAINLTLFDPPVLGGLFSLEVTSTLGSNVSNSFLVIASSLDVELESDFVGIYSDFTVTWSPNVNNFTANLSLLRLSNNLLIPIVSNIEDTGSYTFSLDYDPGAYIITVNSTVGNGTSDIFEITTAPIVLIDPSNASYLLNTTITWYPFDPYQENIEFMIQSTYFSYSFDAPNTGSFFLDFSAIPGFIPGVYTVFLFSNIGIGANELVAYLPTGITVVEPDPTEVIYTNSTEVYIQWYPSTADAPNADLLFLNLNTNETYDYISAYTVGYALINISSINVSPGLYIMIADTAIGSGVSQPFLILGIVPLLIFQPDSSTNVSNVGNLSIIYSPFNSYGANATFNIYQTYNPSVSYQYTNKDSGNVVINFGTGSIIKKDILKPYDSDKRFGDLTKIAGVLSAKRKIPKMNNI